MAAGCISTLGTKCCGFWSSALNLIFRQVLFVIGTSHVALVVKNPPASVGDLRDMGLIPGSGRSPGGGHGNPLQYSCLGNPMGRVAWQAIVFGFHRILDTTEVT